MLSVAHSNVLQLAVLQTLKLSAYTTLIAVPLGVTFALGIHRWRTRTGATFNFVMLLSFVIPELIFGVAMFFVFTSLFSGVGLGTLAETLALVTWNVSWPAIIVQARLATIGNSYSEAAADLGCNPFQTMYRVMLPLLSPAIFASAILVFSTVIDDFVIVDLLSNSAANTPMSVYIYGTQRGGNGGPALNALGTIMLVMSFVIAILGYFGLPADDQRRARHLGRRADHHRGQLTGWPSTGRRALPSRAQVVIVGGGVIGCSIAYHLAHLGWTDVVLLEQHQLTAGTTWHAAGLITSAGMTDETALFFSRYSRDLYARLEAETGHSTGFRPVGHLSLATTPERQAALRREAAWMHGFGVRGRGDLSGRDEPAVAVGQDH